MWKLEKPTRTARHAYTTCINRVQNAGLRARLELIENDIVAAATAFEAAAIATTLHTLQRADDVSGQVTKDEMSAIYTGRMAKKGAPGRIIYDELMATPAHGRCPLCGHRQVSTLDHHLPKARYPALAVAPLNLVPSCMDCNKAKTNTFPLASEDETLHPYFDDIEDDPWLSADVIQTAPAALRFYVAPPGRVGRYHERSSAPAFQDSRPRRPVCSAGRGGAAEYSALSVAALREGRHRGSKAAIGGAC
jgi:hypothetical protein